MLSVQQVWCQGAKHSLSCNEKGQRYVESGIHVQQMPQTFSRFRYWTDAAFWPRMLKDKLKVRGKWIRLCGVISELSCRTFLSPAGEKSSPNWLDALCWWRWGWRERRLRHFWIWSWCNGGGMISLYCSSFVKIYAPLPLTLPLPLSYTHTFSATELRRWWWRWHGYVFSSICAVEIFLTW